MQIVHPSEHLVRVYLALDARKGGWSTSREIATEAKVADRTARAHLHELAEMEIAQCWPASPAYRYRIRPSANKRSVEKLQEAAMVFGIKQ